MTHRPLLLAFIPAAIVASSAIWACSSSSGGPAATTSDDGGNQDVATGTDTGGGDATVADAGNDATSADAGSDASEGAAPDSGSASDASDGGCVEAGASCGTNMVCSPAGACIACDEGAACVPEAGLASPCQAYAVSCAGGAVTCAASGAAAEGTSCGDAGASCTRGTCAPGVTTAVDGGVVDLSTTALSPGRTCSESPSYPVTGLTSTTATLSAAPAAGCLAAGDEVLLINLQGSPTATANVGAYETLTVQSIANATVTFASAKAGSYGQGAGDDVNIGTGVTQQKVALVRIPRFGSLSISAGTTLTSGAWNGQTGGVVAVRANAFTIAGTLTATGLGYREGRWSEDSACSSSLQTESGESITGPGTATTAANVGGSGGIGPGSASFNGDVPLSPSAGHATAGQDGGNGQDRTIGAPGGTYGVGDGSNVTMGSGGGGNLTCNGLGQATALIANPGVGGGGIVLLLGGDVAVSSTGAVTANGSSVDRTASAGGYVLVRGDVVSLGTSQVTAQGSTATGSVGHPITNTAGDGMVAVLYKTSVTGAAAPAAFTKQVVNP
jgi:hypothetical protein